MATTRQGSIEAAVGPTPSWWPFLVVLICYGAVATQQIALPGIYMDAVNPDYMAVRVLNRNAQPITLWLLPGNYLFTKVPVLISFYHGSQQFWLGLPFFWLFGTSVTGLRLTHAIFALGLLATLYALLVRHDIKPWQAALVCAALAIDPGFSYAFRTQSYITLAPCAWLFLSLYALRRAAQANSGWSKWIFASGMFYGWSIVGYFIYAFFLPAMLLALYTWRPPAMGVRRTWVLAAAGLALGAIFYPLGYLLAVVELGGVTEAWNYFQQTQKALKAFSDQPEFSARLAHLMATIDSVFQNWYHHTLIFGEGKSVPGGALKYAILLWGPLVLWLHAEWRRQSPALLRVLIAMVVSFVAIALMFGTRLSGHHFMVLLPLSYAALVAGLHLSRSINPNSRQSVWIMLTPFVALAAINLVGQISEARSLRDSRGVGLYSDAIAQLAVDLDTAKKRPFVYFPDWGLSMPVAFLTGGRVGMDSDVNVDHARNMLCNGRDVAIAAITGDRAQRIAAWQQSLNWGAPSRKQYTQGDGKVAFEIATFFGQSDNPDCQIK